MPVERARSKAKEQSQAAFRSLAASSLARTRAETHRSVFLVILKHTLCDCITVMLLCVLLGELCIGNLPTWEHAVGGRFCVINETTIVIRNFYYDGAGPG